MGIFDRELAWCYSTPAQRRAYLDRRDAPLGLDSATIAKLAQDLRAGRIGREDMSYTQREAVQVYWLAHPQGRQAVA